MRKSSALLLVLVFLTASCNIIVLPSKADSKPIIVPDDYQTIAAAIGNATDGDTVFVKKGTYEEHKLLINKTLSLIGEDAKFTVIKNLKGPLISEPGFNPPLYEVTAIQINANNVNVSGFTITDSGEPIVVKGNGNCIIGNIVLRYGNGMKLEGNNNAVANNTILGYGSGFISCTGSYNTIAYNSMTGDGSDDGLRVSGAFNIVHGNVLTDSGVGIEVHGDGNTITKNSITKSGSILIDGGSRNNIIYANRANGTALSLMGFNNTFYANEIAGVGIGGTHGGSIDAANNIFYHNNFLCKAPELSVYTKMPGPLVWDNGKEGNYWSSYHGPDVNSDGIGDEPYKVTAAYSYYDGVFREEAIVDCGQDKYPLIAPFDIDSVPIELPDWVAPLLDPSPEPQASWPSEPFPIALGVASTMTAAIVGVGLLLYFRKIKKIHIAYI